MHESLIISSARRRSGLSLRALAKRAQTSHATLSAYENGHKVPTVETLDRILRAAGASAVLTTGPLVFSGRARERELRQVLALAAEFPARCDAALSYPPIAKALRERSP